MLGESRARLRGGLPFTPRSLSTPPEQFVDEILLGALPHAPALDRATTTASARPRGDVEMLRRSASARLPVEVVPPVSER